MKLWIMSELDYQNALLRTAREYEVTPEKVEAGIMLTIQKIYAAADNEDLTSFGNIWEDTPITTRISLSHRTGRKHIPYPILLPFEAQIRAGLSARPA